MYIKPKYLITVVLLLLQSATTGAQSDAAKEIERLEEEMNSAFNKLDSATLDRLWSDDLAFVSPNGAIANKAERLAGVRKSPPNVPASTNESIVVKFYGDVAVAIVVSKWTGTTDGKPFSTRFRATHVWAKRAGQWKLVSAHVSQMRD